MARTPLHYETWSGEVTRELIDEGHDVNEADSDGLTPLHFACKDKHYDAAKVLLEAGAHVDLQDKWGNTPLSEAVFGKDSTVELVQLLIDHGADPTIENKSGVSALSLSKQLRKTDCLAVFEVAGYSADSLPKEPRPDLEALRAQAAHDGVSPITVTKSTWQEQFHELWDLLVPLEGAAATEQGEAIRLIGKLGREILDNGGINWDKDFSKMATSLATLLSSGKPVTEREELTTLKKALSGGNATESTIDRLTELAVAWVLANPNPKPLVLTPYQR